jgi:hypothetical protein
MYEEKRQKKVVPPTGKASPKAVPEKTHPAT